MWLLKFKKLNREKFNGLTMLLMNKDDSITSNKIVEICNKKKKTGSFVINVLYIYTNCILNNN